MAQEFNPGTADSINAAVKDRLLANDDTNVLTNAQVTKLNGIATGAQRVSDAGVTIRAGAINFSGGSTGDVLAVRADGTLALAAPAGGGGVADGDKGDITVTAGVWTIDNDVVTLEKLAPAVRASLGLADSAVQQADLDAAIAALVDSSPAALDTLNELAAALGDDANFATTVNNQLASKVGNSVADLPGMESVTREVICTQAEYDARTPPADDATIIYNIVG